MKAVLDLLVYLNEHPLHGKKWLETFTLQSNGFYTAIRSIHEDIDFELIVFKPSNLEIIIEVWLPDAVSLSTELSAISMLPEEYVSRCERLAANFNHLPTEPL